MKRVKSSEQRLQLHFKKFIWEEIRHLYTFTPIVKSVKRYRWLRGADSRQAAIHLEDVGLAAFLTSRPPHSGDGWVRLTIFHLLRS